jgi:hypothetical protein
VKDKWKQLGGSNFDSRLKGPWTVA